MTAPPEVPALPEGFTARPLTLEDAQGVFEAVAAEELVDAFGRAREHGAVRCYLSTDTRAGARAVYEAVGMVVSSAWVNRAVDL